MRARTSNSRPGPSSWAAARRTTATPPASSSNAPPRPTERVTICSTVTTWRGSMTQPVAVTATMSAAIDRSCFVILTKSARSSASSTRRGLPVGVGNGLTDANQHCSQRPTFGSALRTLCATSTSQSRRPMKSRPERSSSADRRQPGRRSSAAFARPAGGSKASNARSAAASASSMRRSNSAANCQPASPCSARLFPSSAPPTRVATAAAWLSFDSSARASSATCTPSSSADAFGSSRPIVRMSLKPITGAFSNDEIHAPPACGTGDGVRSTRQARADFWPSSVVHSCRPSLPRSARNTTPASPKRPSTRWQVPTSVLVGIRLTYPGRAPG